MEKKTKKEPRKSVKASKKVEETLNQSEVKKVESNESNILKTILILLGALIILMVCIYFILQSPQKQNYSGVEFQKVKEGDLILYQTHLLVNYNGKSVPYYFYFRTSPNKLEKVPFESVDNFKILKYSAFNTTEFDCDGDQVIAVANWKNLNDALGLVFLYDPSATCDEKGRYNFFNLIEGNETRIVEVAPHCYNVEIADCEILKATEKIMIETIVKLNTK